jgi:hypothetical protein
MKSSEVYILIVPQKNSAGRSQQEGHQITAPLRSLQAVCSAGFSAIKLAFGYFLWISSQKWRPFCPLDSLSEALGWLSSCKDEGPGDFQTSVLGAPEL